jgi:multidrug resistance efflux pump
MEVLLLGIYSFFAWLPWNITTQVITVTIPIIGITVLILLLNIVAPSSHDIRVINYVVPINPRVGGLVTEVPIEPNRPIQKGDVLFRIDPTSYEIQVKNAEAALARLEVQLITAGATSANFIEELRSAKAQREAIEARLTLARQRVTQWKELAESGAGNRFDYEQAKTPTGEQDETANVRAQILSAEATLAEAKWMLEQTVYYAPANGTVIANTLRPGAMAVPLPMVPAMNFVEDEQWILAIYKQNEVRKIAPGQEAEVAFEMYPGRIVKAKVDSILWATAQGQLPIGTLNQAGGVAPIPPNSLAVRLLPAGEDEKLFLASGAHGAGAVYTDSGHAIHIVRKVIVRVGAKLDWLILKLH